MVKKRSVLVENLKYANKDSTVQICELKKNSYNRNKSRVNDYAVNITKLYSK